MAMGIIVDSRSKSCFQGLAIEAGGIEHKSLRLIEGRGGGGIAEAGQPSAEVEGEGSPVVNVDCPIDGRLEALFSSPEDRLLSEPDELGELLPTIEPGELA